MLPPPSPAACTLGFLVGVCAPNNNRKRCVRGEGAARNSGANFFYLLGVLVGASVVRERATHSSSTRLQQSAAQSRCQGGMDDLAALGTTTAAAAVQNLQSRHAADLVFTRVGNTLMLALNPHAPVSHLFSREELQRHQHVLGRQLPPHIFELGTRCPPEAISPAASPMPTHEGCAAACSW